MYNSCMTPFQAMQHAVDIVHDSEHNKNKISACLVKDDAWITRTNYRPEILKNQFPPDIKIGNSSQFLHAEVACIFDAPFPTDGASLYVTDPMCPNCAKAIASAGIKHVYIDHKGLEKDFARRRQIDFDGLSLPVMEQAGIEVYILYRKEEKLEALHSDIATNPVNNTDIETVVSPLPLKGFAHEYSTESRSWAMAQTDSKTILIVPEDVRDIPHDNNKYRATTDPINRLLFYCSRYGIAIQNQTIITNLSPSSRNIVNAIGYGIRTIKHISTNSDHDPQSDTAIATVKKHDMIEIDKL